MAKAAHEKQAFERSTHGWGKSSKWITRAGTKIFCILTLCQRRLSWEKAGAVSVEADDVSEQSTLGLARHCVSIISVGILLLVLVGVAGGQVGGLLS